MTDSELLRDGARLIIDTARKVVDADAAISANRRALLDSCQQLSDTSEVLEDLAERLIHRGDLLLRAAELTGPAEPAPKPDDDLRLFHITQAVTLAGPAAIWITGLVLGHLPGWAEALAQMVFGVSLGIGAAAQIIKRPRA